MALFDVRVFDPNAKTKFNQDISKTNKLNEIEKKRFSNERIIETEHESFTALVMSATGGMGRQRKNFYLRLAEMISSKGGNGYNINVAWVRRKILFSFIKSIGICLRSSRSVFCSDSLE